MVPHGVRKMAIFLDSRVSRSWWYPFRMSSLKKRVQSWHLHMKSSTIITWMILFLSINWFGTPRSTLALIMCGSGFSLSTVLNNQGWTPHDCFTFRYLLEYLLFYTLPQPFLKWFLQVVSHWSESLSYGHCFLFFHAELCVRRPKRLT